MGMWLAAALWPSGEGSLPASLTHQQQIETPRRLPNAANLQHWDHFTPAQATKLDIDMTGESMLTGSELLATVKELADASKTDLVRAAGYVTRLKDGSERLNFTAFYEALLDAKGVNFKSVRGSQGRHKRRLTYHTKVQFNGNLMVGKAYTAMLSLEPGDDFEIKLAKNQIRLVPLGSTDEDD